MTLAMRIPLLCRFIALGLAFGLALSARPACAEHDTVQRLEYEAQIQSNNGHYSEARDLRALAEALRQNKDGVVSKQVTSDLQRHDLEKAKEALHIR